MRSRCGEAGSTDGRGRRLRAVGDRETGERHVATKGSAQETLREKLAPVPKASKDGERRSQPRRVPDPRASDAGGDGDLPAKDEGWAFEFKWDGIRGDSLLHCGRFRILSRNDRDVTVTYPELEDSAGALTAGTDTAVLDGEIVALGPDGRPSFGALQHRMGVMQASRAAQLAAEQPVVAMLFDILYLNGESTVKEPYTERRRLLESLGLNGSHWQTPPWFEGASRATRTHLEAAGGCEARGNNSRG